MQATRTSAASIFLALLANVALLVVLATNVSLEAPHAVLPDPCDGSGAELTALQASIDAAEHARDRAHTSLEQAAAREQLDMLHERFDAVLARAQACDERRGSLGCGTRDDE